MGFKERLKEARKNSNLTQEQLGQLIGVHKTTIAGYESGNSSPDISKINAILRALNIDANYLWQDELPIIEEKNTSELNSSHILKYKFLDSRGKSVVNAIIDVEFSFVAEKTNDNPKQLEKEKNQP